MISSAFIIYNDVNSPVSLEQISKHLKKSAPYTCSFTEWQGFTTTIPQLRIETAPPLTIQINSDPEYVPAEIEELAERAEGILDAELIEVIKGCNSRLEIMSATPIRVEAEEKTISVYAETSLDPELQGVTAVLFLLAAYLGGYLYDCVNARWMLQNESDV